MKDWIRSLAVQVSAKLGKESFREVVGIASSVETLAPSDKAAFAVLQGKYPPLHLNSASYHCRRIFCHISLSDG